MSFESSTPLPLGPGGLVVYVGKTLPLTLQLWPTVGRRLSLERYHPNGSSSLGRQFIAMCIEIGCTDAGFNNGIRLPLASYTVSRIDLFDLWDVSMSICSSLTPSVPLRAREVALYRVISMAYGGASGEAAVMCG